MYIHSQPDDGDWTGHVPVEYDPGMKLPQTERKNEKQFVSSVEENERAEQRDREISIFRRKYKALIKKREESKERVFIPEKKWWDCQSIH